MTLLIAILSAATAAGVLINTILTGEIARRAAKAERMLAEQHAKLARLEGAINGSQNGAPPAPPAT